MLDIPPRRAAQRLLGRQRIAVAEVLMNFGEIHQLMMRCDLKADAARRVGDLGWQTKDLEPVMHLVSDNLDNLTHRELNVIATVVDLPSRHLGLVHRQQHRMGEIPSVAMRHQAKAALRQDQERAFVEHATDNTPFPRQQLIRPVHVRIAVDDAARVGRQHRLLRAGNQIGETVLLLGLHGRRRLGYRSRQAERKIHHGIEIPPVYWDAADRDELSGLALQRFRDYPNASVRGDYDIEGPPRDCRVQRLAEMGIAVNVLDVGRNFGNLMGSAMEDRHRVAAVLKTSDEKRSAGTGATHN